MRRAITVFIISCWLLPGAPAFCGGSPASLLLSGTVRSVHRFSVEPDAGGGAVLVREGTNARAGVALAFTLDGEGGPVVSLPAAAGHGERVLRIEPPGLFDGTLVLTIAAR